MKRLKKNKKKVNLKQKLKKGAYTGLAVATLASFASGLVNNVSAETRDREVLQSVIKKTPYYLGNSAMGFQDQGFHIYINSSLTPGAQTSFCVDPKMAIKNGAIYTTGVDAGSITPKIQRIAYLGYYLPERMSGNPQAWLASGAGERAYINTQAMIWEQLGVQVRTNTPNYAQFKADINAKLNNWELKPSFDRQTINIKEGETKNVKDTNNVLKDFSNYNALTDLGGVTVKGNEDNSVTIQAKEGIANETGNKEFLYNSVQNNSKKYDPVAEVNLIYKSTESQTLARMGHVDPVGYAYNVNVRQKYEDVDISKLDATTNAELPGARLELIHKNTNKVVDSWTSTTEPHTVKKLLVDEVYILRETFAVNGYDYAEDIEFTVDANGVVNKQHIEMKDNKITGSLELTKLDADNGKEQAEGLGSLDNAEYDVIDDQTGQSVGHLIYDYDTKTSNKIDGLDVTHTYTVKEIKAPLGYHLGVYVDGKLINEGKVKFNWKAVQDKNPSNNIVAINTKQKDSVTKVRINKIDNIDPKIAKHVKGATLTLLDKTTNQKVKLNYNDPNLPFEWVSNGEYLEIRGLELGHEYVLQEIHAPNGYKISKDIEFKVENKEYQDVYMVDTKLDDVAITKVDITTQKELPGAHLELSDKETGKIIEEWVSTEEQHIIKDLEVNKEYVLKETIAPDGYAIANNITFKVDDNGKVLQHVKMEDELLPSSEEKGQKTFFESLDTGDKTALGATATVALLSGLTIAVVAKKRKKENEEK